MGKPTPRRGLQNVRTQSSRRAIASLQSPELYIKLTSLEMERSRRIVERDRLLDRVRVLDERLVEIAREQDEMRYRISCQTVEPSPYPGPGTQAKPNPDVGFKY